MKTYKSHDEYAHRFGIWKENRAAIKAHNLSKKSWSLAINKFGDLTQEEFAEMYLNKYETDTLKDIEVLDTAALPTTIDWVAKGAVTQVKNQGQCGSCWSFSTTGSVEGLHFLEGNQLVSLSEQQLMDCSTSFGNMGCNGGLMDDAFQYVISTGGLTTEKNYPYSATGPNSCEKSNFEGKLFCAAKSYKNVPQKSVEQFKKFLTKGPVSVAIQANQFSFQFYGGGVMSGSCGTQLDHGVLAVGYGTQNGQGFWKVKNSWASSWGEQGFILLAADPSATTSKFNNGAGQCGILMSASAPCMDASCSALTQE